MLNEHNHNMNEQASWRGGLEEGGGRYSLNSSQTLQVYTFQTITMLYWQMLKTPDANFFRNG